MNVRSGIQMRRLPTKRSISLLLLAGAGLGVVLHQGTIRAAVGDVKLTDSLIPFHQPIGIDFHLDNNNVPNLIISSNYPTGEPFNLERIDVATKTHTGFSPLHGLDDELKIATVRPTPACQAFPVGD